jgi:sugar transferase (PEP-CTERM/EpsH1 system associated)
MTLHDTAGSAMSASTSSFQPSPAHPALPPLVVHVIHHLKMGGMENTLVNLINHTPRDQFRHAVVCVEDFSDFRQRITRPDVEVVALQRSKVDANQVRKAIYQLCRRWRPALVHSRNMSGLDALLPAFLARVPVRVHSEHGWDVDNLQGQHWKPALLRKLHAPLVTAYITVSKDLASFLQQRLGIAPARIHHICNGVDVRRFRPGELADKLVLPPGFGDPGVLTVGTVGRIQAVKDQACLVRAVARLAAAQPAYRDRLRLVVVGDGPLLPALRQQVVDAGLQDLAWLPGSSNQIPEILRALDVFVIPSLNEGISNTILEAMASGLPVLASRVGGNPELVIPGLNGELFAAQDDQALAALLASYLDDPARRLRQAAAARLHACEQLSLDTMLQRYADLYAALIGGRPVPSARPMPG